MPTLCKSGESAGSEISRGEHSMVLALSRLTVLRHEALNSHNKRQNKINFYKVGIDITEIKV